MNQTTNYTNKQARTTRFFEWANRHARPIVGVTVIVALTLGGLCTVVADTGEPQIDPESEIYTLLDRADVTVVIAARRLDRLEELVGKITAFITEYNQKAKPFRWTYEGKPLKAA